MKNPLIGEVLKSLWKSYEEGHCDDLPEEQEALLLKELSVIKDSLELKQDKVLTIEEASQYLGVTRQTVNKYVKQGLLHPKKQLGGVLQFTLKEIKQLIKQLKNS